MNSKDQGLTVGELTISIGAILIAVLIWTTVSRKEDSQNTSIHSCSSNQQSLAINQNCQPITIQMG